MILASLTYTNLGMIRPQSRSTAVLALCTSFCPCIGSPAPWSPAPDNVRFRNAGAPSRVVVSRCSASPAPSASTADLARYQTSSIPASRFPCSLPRSGDGNNDARVCGCEKRRCLTPKCCDCGIFLAEMRKVVRV